MAKLSKELNETTKAKTFFPLFTCMTSGKEASDTEKLKSFFDVDYTRPASSISTPADARLIVEAQKKADEKRKKEMTELLEALFEQHQTPSLKHDG